jgi:hypothetical protein
MNERIEKLLEQCQIETYGVNGELLEIGFDAEKFAELIVRECSKVITDLPNRMVDAELSPYNEGWRNGRLLAKEHIEQHFGVEE